MQRKSSELSWTADPGSVSGKKRSMPFRIWFFGQSSDSHQWHSEEEENDPFADLFVHQSLRSYVPSTQDPRTIGRACSSPPSRRLLGPVVLGKVFLERLTINSLYLSCFSNTSLVNQFAVFPDLPVRPLSITNYPIWSRSKVTDSISDLQPRRRYRPFAPRSHAHPAVGAVRVPYMLKRSTRALPHQHF